MSLVYQRLVIRSRNCLTQCLRLVSGQLEKGPSLQFSSVAYIWGAGDGGQLGTRTQEDSLLPIKFPVSEEVSHIGCGCGFTLAADTSSSCIWTTGLNTFGQLGRQLTCNNLKESDEKPAAVNIHVGTSLSMVDQISCGRSHSVVLFSDGEVLSCGGNYHGQCGVGDLGSKLIRHFTKIPDIPGKIVQIACGMDHTLLLSDEGEVFTCGWGADGQTGLGHFQNEATFKPIQGALKDVRIKQIATSADCCLALSVDGEAFSWGNNEYQQLATGSDEDQIAVPTRAKLLNNLPQIKQVSAGGSNCAVVTESGDVYSWGYGVLGHGREVSFTKTPKKIQEFDNIDEPVARVCCGPDYMTVITDSGSLYTWGRGSFGRLGLGSTEDQWIPKKVPLPGEVIEISCGLDHMAAIIRLT